MDDDIQAVLSEIEDKEMRMRLKRRWLLGLDISEELSKSKHHSPDNNTEFVPESLLREDDLFFETTKSHLEESYGFSKNEQVCNDVQQKDCTLEVVRHLHSFTNKGLYLIATILTADSTSFDKTRLKMKEIIRSLIKKDFGSSKEDIINQLHQVLSDPTNVRKDCDLNLATRRRNAAMKILNELGDLTPQTLRAMKRKLNGSKIIPTLEAGKFGKDKSKLMNQVRLASEKMLSELSVGDKLPGKLAKALSVVDLTFQMSPGYKTTAATDFYLFSGEIKILQNNIVKAVLLLPKLKLDELKRLHLCLDPEVEVSNDSLRFAVKQMLIEYLYESDDMRTIPMSRRNALRDALSLVKQMTQNEEHKFDPIKEEMECILNVSAEVKQLFWQCIPDYEFDQDFDDAYMEDSVDDCDTVVPVKFCDLNHEEESGAEMEPTESTHASSSENRMVIRDLAESSTRVLPRSLNVTPTSSKSSLMGDRHDLGMEVENQSSSSSVQNINSDDRGEQEEPRRRNKNQYLAVQEIADETSLLAHNLIGGLLEKMADSQGLELGTDERAYLGGQSRRQKHKESENKNTPAKKRKRKSGNKQASSSQEKSDESIIVSVLQEQMPSLDESVLMKLKELFK